MKYTRFAILRYLFVLTCGATIATALLHGEEGAGVQTEQITPEAARTASFKELKERGSVDYNAMVERIGRAEPEAVNAAIVQLRDTDPSRVADAAAILTAVVQPRLLDVLFLEVTPVAEASEPPPTAGVATQIIAWQVGACSQFPPSVRAWASTLAGKIPTDTQVSTVRSFLVRNSRALRERRYHEVKLP